MLKQFIACPNDFERYRFYLETAAGDWSEQELDSIGNIIGVEIQEVDGLAGKYIAVRSALEARVGNVA